METSKNDVGLETVASIVNGKISGDGNTLAVGYVFPTGGSKCVI